MQAKVVYDGSKFCGNGCGCGCPIATRIKPDVVMLSDPKLPERGHFTMSVEEYNIFLKHAKPIE